MLVNTPQDLIQATFAALDNKLDIKNVEFGPDLRLVITIRDEEWDDPTLLDYRTAQVILNIQRDVLGIYNSTQEKKINLKNICNHPEFIVKVKVEKGCIKYTAELADILKNFCANMNAKEKIITAGIVAGVLMTGCAAWVGTEYIKYLKDVEVKKLESKNQITAIKVLESTNLALIENSKTPTYIISHLSKDGSISIGNEDPLNKKEAQKISKERKETPKETYNIDGVYNIDQYDYVNLRAKVSTEESSFWASTKWLSSEDRARLKRISELAIDNSEAQNATLQITATLQDNEIKEAAILGISGKRPSSKKLKELMSNPGTGTTHPQTPTPKQASLLKFMEVPSTTSQ